MTGAITFSGLGSGLDIDAIVSGLVSASSQPIRTAQTRISEAQAAVSTLSGIGGLMRELRDVVDTLDTASELASYSGSTGNEDALGITVSGTAKPATYSVTNVSLAQEQRHYSGVQTSRDGPLGISGDLVFTQDGTDYTISVSAEDSLEDIGIKINEGGADIGASIVAAKDGFYLQVRSKETGASQAFTVNEAGLSASLGIGAGKIQDARNSSVTIDGLQIESETNTISDAVLGVSFELKQNSTETFNVSVKSDSSAMKKSLEDFVSKYNNVLGRIHSVSGFGSNEGSSKALRGDSTLRSITNRLSGMILSSAGTGGSLDTLADLGMRLNNNGTLRVDAAKMEEALNANPDNFAKVLAGDDSSDGLMDVMGNLLKSFIDVGTGSLDLRKEALNNEIKLFRDTADREQRRLDVMELRLRETFSIMDAQMGAYNVDMNFLARL